MTIKVGGASVVLDARAIRRRRRGRIAEHVLQAGMTGALVLLLFAVTAWAGQAPAIASMAAGASVLLLCFTTTLYNLIRGD